MLRCIAGPANTASYLKVPGSTPARSMYITFLSDATKLPVSQGATLTLSSLFDNSGESGGLTEKTTTIMQMSQARKLKHLSMGVCAVFCSCVPNPTQGPGFHYWD